MTIDRRFRTKKDDFLSFTNLDPSYTKLRKLNSSKVIKNNTIINANQPNSNANSFRSNSNMISNKFLYITPLTLIALIQAIIFLQQPLAINGQQIHQSPYFVNRPQPMYTIVNLKAVPGTVVYKLQARTDNPNNHGNIRYMLALDRSGDRFEVDPRSGEIRTKGFEPFIQDKEYLVYVRAEDHSRPNYERKFPSTQDERISIVGGRRPPQFYMQNYSISIMEDTKKDVEMMEVKAKSFSDRDIRYTLQVKSKGTGTFIIDPIFGKIKLARELDYEDIRQPRTYLLKVNASEDSGGFTTTTDVTVTVLDVNDNPPRFDLPDYQVYNVLEDVKIGTKITTIQATDADTGRNAEIEYSIDRPEFTIDSRGNILTSRRLDADVNNTYVLTVKATDKGSPPLTGTAVVRVYTENTNDEAPKFSQDVYTPNVDENAGPRTLVTTVVASDKDGDNVIFGFSPSTKTNLFQIDERTGVIRLSNNVVKLDRDKYELNVTAKDDGKCCEGKGNNIIHTSTAVVVVFITDVNDQKPTFEDCNNYNPTVKEGSPYYSLVTTVKATDNDKSYNGKLRYSVVQQHNQRPKFIIDEVTGELRTNKVFDREGEDGRFVSVTVKAVDQGIPPLEGVCSFKVEITDDNDNPPLFDRQEYHEFVRQDTSIGDYILRVSASDEDIELNGKIIYSLAPNVGRDDLDYFMVSSETGWVTLRKPLDRDSYTFRAIARDAAPPYNNASVEIIIDIVDRANSPPQWEQSVYVERIRENAPLSSKIISIRANSGIKDNPNVFYTMIRGGTEQTNKLSTFYLSTRAEGSYTYADIFLNYNLDYERITFYNLTVRAENDGNQQLASECSVNIEVEDVNDEIPLFVEREQQTVLESMPPGTRVTQVQAQDKDGTSPNNIVTYSIESQDGAEQNFTIERNTGEIFTKVEFDREEKQNYALVIRATDGALSDRPGNEGRPNSVTTKIRIGIGDKNDNSPYFDKSLYEAEVNEDEDQGHVLITVTAKDKDESSKLRYEIVKGNIGGGAFAVNNETGTIVVAGPLDYELRKEYKLVLVASDNLNENFTNVIIKVKDVNDNPPIFDRPTYQTTIVEADDKKLPKKILQYNLTLVVSDSLLENSTTVRVRVKDVNDKPPEFSQKAYEVRIDEQMKERQRIVQVSATDGDRDRPQNIVYFLADTSQGSADKNDKFFSINPTTGEIFVERPLDRDAPNGRPVWRFTVYAEDEGGHNGLVGYADVVVNLRDINDNVPLFPNNVYIGNVSERGVANQAVMTMQAIDYDDPEEGNNAKLRYAIEQNQVNEQGELIFRIDEETGVIYTAVGQLDRETNPEYTLKVTATDGGNNQGYAQVVIKVKDVNDMPPQFLKKDLFVEVDETLDSKIPEAPILIVQVSDADTLESNRFSYRVIDGFGADKFTMVTNSDGTGSLKIAKPLDFEDPEQKYGFNITIQVNDGGDIEGIEHTDNATVRIRLKDINDNPPEFDKQSIEVTVRENAPVGTQLANFTARDPDQGGTSKVRFSIDRASDKRRQFAINPKLGTVTVQRPLDREDQPRITIKIIATDDGFPQRSAVATLSVILDDVNDNAPRFLKDYVSVVYENSPPGKIEEIQAADLDDRGSGNGPPFIFRMDPNAPQHIKELFDVIHDGVGEGMASVHTKQVLDREQQKEYQVPILIRDSGRPFLSSVNYLKVVVGDINDNKMHPGSKIIFVYNYRGQYKNIPIGRVHVEDMDDWDLHDKKFMWEQNMPHPNFHLDRDNGTIFMKNVTEGSYLLRFTVTDKKFTQDVPANVTVVVKNLPEEAVYNSGSIRLSGITDEDFVRVWDWRSQSEIQSKYELFRETLSRILREPIDNVDIFSVMTHYPKGRVPVTDVRFSAHGSPYHKSAFLNGYVGINRRVIEKELGLNITMVGIDECMTELVPCDGSCSNTLQVEPFPYVVNANRTSLVGVFTRVVPVCECAARSLDEIDGCNSQPPFCLHDGKCTMQGGLATCECLPGYTGPQCQITSRTFRGKGWAWFPPLEQCESSHLSLEFMTEQPNGLIFYNGPVDAPEVGITILEDFISLELSDGKPRLIVDFGSGTSEVIINPQKELNDGEWHRIDIFWNREDIRMMLDNCRDAKFEEDTDRPTTNRSMCEQKANIKQFSEFLNVNSPLQLGGVFHREIDKFFHWKSKHTRQGFDGCIRNLIHNSRTYDLGEPGGSVESDDGCTISEKKCQANSLTSACEHGQCIGSYKTAYCQCEPGWTGGRCDIETQIKMFQQSSFIRYALSFEPNPYITDIQLRFRTRVKNGELIRMSGRNTREYCVLEIKEKRLRFKYQLNQVHSVKEFELTLPDYNVSNGMWHTVRVIRYGSTASIDVDGGGGKKSNEITEYIDLHQLLVVSKQGILAGGEVNHMGPSAYYVENGLSDTCVTDIRIDQRHLPMENGSENAVVTESRNLIEGCVSTNTCAKQTTCPSPFVCTDLWNHHECTCPTGWSPTDEGSCTDINECASEPCFNGGTCINFDNGQGFLCMCTSAYMGEVCHLPANEKIILVASNTYYVIAFIAINIVVLFIVVFFVFRKSGIDQKYGTRDHDDDVRENIINYADEGGGEDDMHAFDITPLRIPVDSSGTMISARGKQNIFTKPGILKDLRKGTTYDGDQMAYGAADLSGRQFIDPGVRLIEGEERDGATRALDDLRNYAYEGCGSTAGSLSSLASIGNVGTGGDDEVQNFDYLSRWGPKFQNMAYLYRHKDSNDPQNEQ